MERDDLPGADDPIRFKEIGSSLRLVWSSVKEESAEMSTLQRNVVKISVFCLIGCMVQALIALPLLLILYGWGYSV